jgi:hypothetical protein
LQDRIYSSKRNQKEQERIDKFWFSDPIGAELKKEEEKTATEVPDPIAGSR